MNFRFFTLVFVALTFISLQTNAADPLRRYKSLEPEMAPVDVVFKDLDGDDIKLSDYKGKIIILNFWATWCMPCISEMPSLNKLSKLYKHDDFVVIAIAKDAKGPITPKEFRKRTKFYQMVFAMDAKEDGLFDQMKVEGLPTTFVINEEGMIMGKLVGGTDWAHEDVLNLMQRYIDGDPPKPTSVSLKERFTEWFEAIRDWFNDLFKSDDEKLPVIEDEPKSDEKAPKGKDKEMKKEDKKEEKKDD